jgi:4-hydroxy-3-polyprenylbenzoate decarboxylase
MARVIVGISGASGIILACHTIRILVRCGHEIELVMSRPAQLTGLQEIGPECSTPEGFVAHFEPEVQKAIRLHRLQDLMSPISSGSLHVHGMIVVPCSMATVAAISIGLGDNLLRRAADVTLKERRPLVLVPRESPFSQIHLENLLRLSKLGAVVVPPMPAWYFCPKSLAEVEEQIAGKIVESLGFEVEGLERWTGGVTAPKEHASVQ